jgi:hypothetical protein
MTVRAWRWGLTAWLVLRVVATAAAWFSLHELHIGPTVGVPGYRPPHLSGMGAMLAGAWLRADALWYLKIATQGYGQGGGTLAFYPAFPMLVALVNRLVGNELWAGLLVANAGCLVGFTLLYSFFELAGGAAAARAGVIAAAVFPTAFFLVAPYGESMFLLFGAASLLAASKGRSAWALAAGALAALSRPFGVLIAIPLAGLAWAAKSGGRARWLIPLGPVAGAAAWFIYAGQISHEPLTALHVQAQWQRAPAFFGATLISGFKVWHQYQASDLGPYMLFDLVATLLGIAAVVLGGLFLFKAGKRRLALAIAVYGFAALLAPLSLPFAPRPLMSNPRFVLALFPVFIGVALLPRKIQIPLAVLSAAGLFVATAVYVAARPLF